MMTPTVKWIMPAVDQAFTMAGKWPASPETTSEGTSFLHAVIPGTAGETKGAPIPTTQIALFRGINVGKAKRVAMADLRTLLEKLGYGDVRTLLNSGNVVFTTRSAAASDAADRIGKAMTRDLGVTARITVITAAVLDAAIKDNPLVKPSRDPSRLLVTFLADPKDRKQLKPLVEQDWATEGFVLGKHAAYLWCPEGILQSRAAKALEKALGDRATSRNWATMLKLQALAADTQ